MTAAFPKGGSEYGGLRGPIAPPPHSILDSAWEQASLAARTNSADATDPLSSIDGVYAEDMKKAVQ